MPKPILLSASEAGCLEALRSGTDKKMLIALRAGLNLEQTKLALGTLASSGLAATTGYRAWHLTPRGKRVDISIAPAVRTRGRRPTTGSVPGAAASRVLALLDRPRRGAELATLLGVTRQRVHQLVVALSAFGLIRSADPNGPTFVVALRNDKSTLLRPDQERVLSAFPETEATTPSKIAVVTNMYGGKAARVVDSLLEAGLVERTGHATYGDLYRLTAAGSAHWQRSAFARQADTPPLPYRSGRVRDVLSHLESHGPTRTRDIGLALGIPQPSINALMQCLKRKNTVRNQTDARRAPYELTPEGCGILAAMKRQAAESTAT